MNNWPIKRIDKYGSQRYRCGVMRTSFAVISALVTGIMAIFSCYVRSGEALIVLILFSLGLWEGLYLMGSWLAAILLPE
jgi:hypothetical protein